MSKKLFRAYLLSLLFVFSFVPFVAAQTEIQKDFSNVKIKNFGEMDDHFFRGAQPKKEDYQTLASLGVKTVIDLRDDAKDYAKSSAEAAGLKYVNIPMSDTKYPKPENVEAFLSLVNNPETGVFYVHCAGGRHRTGVMGAVYRFNKYGWNYDQVYAEMKKYDFYTRWGHGSMKDFVVDYAEKMKIAPAVHETAHPVTGESK
jgi:protein tyrosine/serine phosphatase